MNKAFNKQYKTQWVVRRNSELAKIREMFRTAYKNIGGGQQVIDTDEVKGANTSNVQLCGNRGCGFNQNLYCSATGTECFGYIENSI